MNDIDRPVDGEAANEQRRCSCHCGAVEFTAEFPMPFRGGRCTCSICTMKGAIMVGVPLSGLKVTQGEDLLTCYRFNTREAKHYFCSRCGIHCFHQRRSFPDQYAVNAACIEGADIYADFTEVPVIDGRRHPNDHGGKWQRAGTFRFESE